jgi:murein L,D-transpeptidase YcbB/YkuD
LHVGAVKPTIPRVWSSTGARSRWLAAVATALLLANGSSSAVAVEFDSAATAWLHGDQPALLDAEILRYELIRAAGGWPVLSSTTQLAPGQRHADVPLLRQRLLATGDISGAMGADKLRFDAALLDGLRQFQRRHGAVPNGRVDRQTLDALNVSVIDRLAQLRAAQVAWAAQSAPDAGRRVWVNVPEAEVIAFADAAIALRLRAVVGHPSRPTPVLSSSIRRVIVNPPWTVPPRIAGQDLLPRQLADAEFFSARGIRVYQDWSATGVELDPRQINWQSINPARFPYRLRQDPGPQNSLGRYKFEFFNEYDVYLHDTPAKLLLGLNVRSLSSGCVRVEDSAALARWLATESQAERLQAATATYETRALRLPAAVPIDIVYLTAWVAPATGAVNFRRDVYAHAASVAATAASAD